MSLTAPNTEREIVGREVFCLQGVVNSNVNRYHHRGTVSKEPSDSSAHFWAGMTTRGRYGWR